MFLFKQIKHLDTYIILNYTIILTAKRLFEIGNFKFIKINTTIEYRLYYG